MLGKVADFTKVTVLSIYYICPYACRSTADLLYFFVVVVDNNFFFLNRPEVKLQVNDPFL